MTYHYFNGHWKSKGCVKTVEKTLTHVPRIHIILKIFPTTTLMSVLITVLLL